MLAIDRKELISETGILIIRRPSQLTTDHLRIAKADRKLEHTQSSAHRSLGCLL